MPEIIRCNQCETEIASALLACPGCGALRYAHELKQIASEAERAGTPVAALSSWRRALELLPPESRQYAAITAKVKDLAEQVDRGAPGQPASKNDAATNTHRGLIGGAIAIAIALVTKFKFVLIFLLTKGKLVLLGLTKGSTFFSMFTAFGVYWAMFGWKFAAGLILSIYIHEMGHVFELQRFGIRASAPMFVPGLGAMVLLKEKLHSPVEDARVGLAGPWWGLAAALVAWAWAWLGQSQLAAAIAHIGAWINLLNLMPVWTLDGARAFRALSRVQRWIAVAALAGVFAVLREAMVGIVLIVAIVRAFDREVETKGDTRTLIDYWFLAAALAAVSHANRMVPLAQLK